MKQINPLLLGMALLGCGFAMRPASASVIVADYDFPTSQGTTLPSASSDADPQTTAGSLHFGAGITAGGVSTQAGNAANSLYVRPLDNSTEANAVGGNRYFTFTITPNAGSISFDSLAFDYRRDGVGSAEFFALYTSETGFIAGDSIASGTLTDVSTTSFSAYAPIDLGSIASLQNVSGPVEFRIYLWGATTQTDITRFDNIVLSAAAVPEPATAPLLALAAAIPILLRSRRRK